MTQICHNGQPSHGGDRKIFEAMTSIQGMNKQWEDTELDKLMKMENDLLSFVPTTNLS